MNYGPALVRVGDQTEDRGGKSVRVWFADATMETKTGRVRIRVDVDETVIRALYARALDWTKEAAVMLGFGAPAPEQVSGWDLFEELDKMGKSQVFKDITRAVDQAIQSPEMRAAMNFIPYGELVRQGIGLGTGAARGATEGGPAAMLKALAGRGMGFAGQIPGLPALPPGVAKLLGGGAPAAAPAAERVSGVDRRPLPGPARATARMLSCIGRAKAGDASARGELEEVGRMALRGSRPHQKAAALAAVLRDAPALSPDVSGWLDSLAAQGCCDDDEAGAAERRSRRRRRARSRARA
jgi:hypothetical protein